MDMAAEEPELLPLKLERPHHRTKWALRWLMLPVLVQVLLRAATLRKVHLDEREASNVDCIP